jgi:pimeloyl-ACP methyl ester carboxylesterase
MSARPPTLGAVSSGLAKLPDSGIEIAYETFGEASGTPLLLIMGLGTQMIAWPDEMCESLAAKGMFVVRYDNRDVGLSTHLRSVHAPPPAAVILRRARPPYTIGAMARDAAGLLDCLGLESAHVVGASMGGFIAQVLAIRFPARVRSLTLIMTSTGSLRVGRPRTELVWRAMRRRPGAVQGAAVEEIVETFRIIGSPGYPFDEERLRDLAERSFERSYDPGGYLRQLSAILAQRDRTRELRRLDVPTTVVHGLSDPLVSVSGGRALARAIRGARFVGVPGMGHDLPPAVVGRIEREIEAVVARGEDRLSARR